MTSIYAFKYFIVKTVNIYIVFFGRIFISLKAKLLYPFSVIYGKILSRVKTLIYL